MTEIDSELIPYHFEQRAPFTRNDVRTCVISGFIEGLYGGAYTFGKLNEHHQSQADQIDNLQFKATWSPHPEKYSAQLSYLAHHEVPAFPDTAWPAISVAEMGAGMLITAGVMLACRTARFKRRLRASTVLCEKFRQELEIDDQLRSPSKLRS